MAEPWAFVAHKDGEWKGVIHATVGEQDIKDFYADFAGYEIKTVYSREEWLEVSKPGRLSPSE